MSIFQFILLVIIAFMFSYELDEELTQKGMKLFFLAVAIIVSFVPYTVELIAVVLGFIIFMLYNLYINLRR